jgi:hypothetical protein
LISIAGPGLRRVNQGASNTGSAVRWVDDQSGNFCKGSGFYRVALLDFELTDDCSVEARNKDLIVYVLLRVNESLVNDIRRHRIAKLMA